MKTTLKKPRRSSDQDLWAKRHEEILETAAKLFAEHGYSNTDTQFLADKLQVGKGTLYRYFPSKRALFLAAADRVMHKLREYIDARVQGIDDPLERICTAICAFLGFVAEQPEFIELLIQERAQFRDRKKPTYMEHREKNIERWRALYRDLISQGRVRNIPVERITDVIGNVCYGAMFTNYFSGQAKPYQEQARDILDVVFLGLLTEPERRRLLEKGLAGLNRSPGSPKAETSCAPEK